MEQAADCRAIAGRGAWLGPGRRLQFEFVNPDNEWEVRKLLRETPVTGWVSLSFEREPDYLLGATLEGPVHQSVIAREPDSGRLVGSFSRSVRLAWINGEPRSLGYLGMLRMDRHFRGRTRCLRDGYEALRLALHDPAETPFYATTIIEGNAAARRVLTAGLPGLPAYRQVDRLCTLAMPTRQGRWRMPPGVSIQPATESDLPGIADCLQRNYARFQYAPLWSAEDLRSAQRCRALTPGDFIVALRGSAVVGCLALWDQRGFKQYVVRGYDGPVMRWRRLINGIGPLLGLPRLPEVGQPLHQASLSHVAADGDDPVMLRALVRAGLGEACRRGIPLLTTALSARHAALPAVKAGIRHLEYHSIVYVV
ncbi:MAG TPA: hypothetical protein VIT93_05310, partial [Dehalococcoidia bacterium]